MSATDYEYDARGNVEAVRIGQDETTYTHSGDILTSVTGPDGLIKNFSHDVLGRMTYDGTTDQSMTYNILDLVGKVSKGGATLANYSYLADGTKISALDGGGEGLVYRGPFVYRRSTGGGAISLTLESAAFGGGRLTPSGAMLYVTDYLGSVRAVVNGSNGAIYKASDYSPYGEQSDAESMQTASTPAWITFRDAYTGQEDQHPDFGTGYTDFGARQYSPALRRWMTTDPLSEKYYGISPYAFCNNNPVNFVDPDGSYIAEKNIQLWNLNKQKITNKVSALQNRVSRLEHKGKSEVRIGQLNDRINGLQQTLSVMSTLEASNNGYVISSIDGTLGGVTLDIEKNLIKIDYTKGSVGSFIHEVTHAGQFEAGELAFDPTNGSTHAQDIFDEIAAYKAQKDYVGGKPIRYTKEYLYSLKDPYTGLPLYAPGGQCNTAQFYITTKTSYSVVLMAYTGKLTSDNRPFYQATKMFYKYKGIQ